MSCKPVIKSKFKSFLQISLGGSLTFLGICIYKGDDYVYKNFLMPSLQYLISAESAHNLSIKMAKNNLVPKSNENFNDLPLLKTTVWNINFDNPIGLAAGFDKNGEAINGLNKIGFGFIEIGSVTPLPQPGNAKPRVFRLIDDKAVINRYGFNSYGHEQVFKNIENTYKSNADIQVKLGINLGKNKESLDASSDYIKGIEIFKNIDKIDYFVINISSPNTPGLRNLQQNSHFEKLLDEIFNSKVLNNLRKPFLIKLSPDLSNDELKTIVNISLKKRKKGYKIDGFIISNTTISRPKSLKSEANLVNEQGGLSGQPLKNLSTQMIKETYKLTNGTIPIIGVGGVSSGKDAYEKIKAGASLIQVYTAITYNGPPLIRSIKHELAELLRQDGYTNVSQAVGKDVR